MTMATLLVYLVLNSSMEWQFDSVVHLNGTGARAYCEEMRRWKDHAYSGKPGDLRVICTDDKGEKT
jgi:hypothetical protein